MAKGKGKPKHNPGAVVVSANPGETSARALARQLMAPSVQAACTIRALEQSDDDIQGFIDEIRDQIQAVHENDMGRSEAMLIAQAHTLNDLFNTLTRRAASNMGQYINAAETYLKLALRAQSQCRATLETLVTVKNPPVIYAKQANVTSGPQQINNGVPARTRENETEQNKLLEQRDGERLDFGKAGAAGGIDQDLEAVGVGNGAKERRRQS